jgi:hypothetical protein
MVRRLRKQRVRIGSQDLRIAAIALVRGFTVVTSNVSVRSRDVLPRWAGFAAELTEAVAPVVRCHRSTLQSAGRCDLRAEHRDTNSTRWGGRMSHQSTQAERRKGDRRNGPRW